MGPDTMMEIEILQGTDIKNGTVRSVRIKERKKENWEGTLERIIKGRY